MTPRLVVQDLSKGFTLHVLGGKRLQAFPPMSFSVEPGECLQLAGPSGTGKSSLLKCLYRTYRPSAGRALLRGNGGHVDLAAAPEPEILRLRRDAIGYVSQFFQAIPRLTAVTVVAEPLLEQGLNAGEARRRACAMLERLDVPASLWDGYPSTFSGGERQRVNLARALVATRALLLLDEPVASLDPARRARVLQLLAELKRDGAALIAVFHDVERPALVDRTLTLHEADP
jgi:alpha-D-ribose 1-methylphosphonate 5-triphosphate synthase subunit PhnL